MKKIALLTLVLIGCGGGGVDDSKKLADLSVDEAKDLCEEVADSFPQRTVDCSGVTITIGFDKAECATDNDPAPSTCTATAGDVRDCADAMSALTDEQICTSDALPAACAPLEEC